MQNSEWKRLVMGLMSLNDDKGRIEALQAHDLAVWEKEQVAQVNN